jgi:hypothetical protein
MRTIRKEGKKERSEKHKKEQWTSPLLRKLKADHTSMTEVSGDDGGGPGSSATS